MKYKCSEYRAFRVPGVQSTDFSRVVDSDFSKLKVYYPTKVGTLNARCE